MGPWLLIGAAGPAKGHLDLDLRPPWVRPSSCPGPAAVQSSGGGGGGGWGGASPGGGGALRYQMATHCQTAAQSGSGERQNIGAVNSFKGRKGGRSTSN